MRNRESVVTAGGAVMAEVAPMMTAPAWPVAPGLTPRSPGLRRAYLIAEFSILFVGGPLVAYLELLPLPLIPTLLLFTALAMSLLLLDRTFDRRRLLGTADFWRRTAMAALRFVPFAAALGVAFAFYEPARLFELLRGRPELWLLVMALYPIFSVYPQELIYRTFMFHRYRLVFPRRWMMIGASAGAFAYMHIIFENAIAVALTLIGGVLFAETYDRTRSTLVVWAEHALFGCFIFTIGLGVYFYGGSVRMAEEVEAEAAAAIEAIESSAETPGDGGDQSGDEAF